MTNHVNDRVGTHAPKEDEVKPEVDETTDGVYVDEGGAMKAPAEEAPAEEAPAEEAEEPEVVKKGKKEEEGEETAAEPEKAQEKEEGSKG